MLKISFALDTLCVFSILLYLKSTKQEDVCHYNTVMFQNSGINALPHTYTLLIVLIKIFLFFSRAVIVKNELSKYC